MLIPNNSERQISKIKQHWEVTENWFGAEGLWLICLIQHSLAESFLYWISFYAVCTCSSFQTRDRSAPVFYPRILKARSQIKQTWTNVSAVKSCWNLSHTCNNPILIGQQYTAVKCIHGKEKSIRKCDTFCLIAQSNKCRKFFYHLSWRTKHFIDPSYI